MVVRLELEEEALKNRLVPTTSNVYCGVAVPIPTLPSPVILKKFELELATVKNVAGVDVPILTLPSPVTLKKFELELATVKNVAGVVVPMPTLPNLPKEIKVSKPVFS